MAEFLGRQMRALFFLTLVVNSARGIACIVRRAAHALVGPGLLTRRFEALHLRVIGLI